MLLKYLFIIIAFFISAILEAAIPFSGLMSLSFVFILFFILIFFEKKSDYRESFLIALIASFFLYVSMLSYFAVFAVSLLIIYAFEKLAMNFLRESREKKSVFQFTPLFAVSFLIFKVFSNMPFDLTYIKFVLGAGFLIELAYNLFFAVIGFYIYKKIFYQGEDESQLKLFK